MTTPTMEKIKVMLAFDEGKKLEYQYLAGDPPHIWKPHPPGNPNWNWVDFNWRVAPAAPRKFTRWFHEDHKGNILGMYTSKESAETMAQYIVHEHRKVVAFEMTEIPENAS